MRQELRKILARVFIALLIFLIGVVIYKQGNPYAYPGLENRILFVLVPSGFVLLYLYLEERENRNRLFSVLMVTIGRLYESKFMSFCESIWERSPSLVHVHVSKVLAVLYTYLYKMSGYMLKQDLKQVVSHAFLGMLLIVALQSIFPQPPLEWARTPVMIVAVALGVVTFYLNRDKLGEIENEARQEKLKENLRMMEFDEKYPRVNGVWGVRRVQRVVRWMYKEGWWYSGGLIFIVLSGFWLRIWNLGRLGFHGDEFFHQLAADGIKETLLPVLPNGLLYFRGTFTSYLSALGSSMFNNEFGYRIYPTIFSFILMLYSFILTRRYFTKQVSYLYLVLVSSDLWIVEFSRYLRFYGTIIFLFVIITLLLIDENLLNNSKKKIALVGFLVLSAFESVVFFIFLPLILLRIWISDAHIVKKFQYAIIFLFPFVLRYYANISNKSLATIPVSNTQQFDILVKILDAINTNINYNFDPFFIKAIYFAYPFPTIIVFMGLIFIIFNFKSISKDKKLIYSIFLVLLMEFTILQAKHQQRIISPLLGLFFIAFAINISNILQAIKTCKLSKYLFFFIIILSVSSLIVPSFNIPLREYGSPFHEIKLLSSAEPYYPDYKTISNFVIDNANPNDLILISGPSPVVYWKYMSLKDKNNVDGIQTYRPGTKIINDKYYDIYTDMLIYDSISDITSIIENYEKGDVYIIFSYSSSPVNSLILDEMDTWSHLNKDLRSYIIKHSELVYVGKDNTSKVYLFAGNEIK